MEVSPIVVEKFEKMGTLNIDTLIKDEILTVSIDPSYGTPFPFNQDGIILDIPGSFNGGIYYG